MKETHNLSIELYKKAINYSEIYSTFFGGYNLHNFKYSYFNFFSSIELRFLVNFNFC